MTAALYRTSLDEKRESDGVLERKKVPQKPERFFDRTFLTSSLRGKNLVSS